MRNMIYLLVAIAMIAMIGGSSGATFVKNNNTTGPQDLVTIIDTLPAGKILDLTGIDPSVFLGQMFMTENTWTSGNSASWTASQNAFLRNNEEDGRGLGNSSPKRAFIGSVWESQF